MKWCQVVRTSRFVEISLPELGTTRVKFSLWHVQLGERVLEGDRVAEVLIPGATYDVGSPATGRLIEKRARLNEPLEPGQILGVIEEEG
jgi:pyruvate/2-oxoglutarate dehydrogenase complex dihydrolipoamide acyltransferase (E2) component